MDSQPSRWFDRGNALVLIDLIRHKIVADFAWSALNEQLLMPGEIDAVRSGRIRELSNLHRAESVAIARCSVDLGLTRRNRYVRTNETERVKARAALKQPYEL